MKSDLKHSAEKFNKKHKYRKIWQKIVTVLSAIVVFITTYALILPAITRENQPICGMEEHIHTEECYKFENALFNCDYETHEHNNLCYDNDKNLICGYSDFIVHKHNEFCYNGSDELICEIKETVLHKHDEKCYDENDKELLVCEKDEIVLHEHIAECFNENGKLICNKLKLIEHNHTESCLSNALVKTLSCGLDEHTHHELNCFTSFETPLETAEQWEETLPQELTGDSIYDFVLVAKSQIGYTEDKSNKTNTSDGDVRYASRYGTWFGDPYAEWNAPFVAFCMHYAGIENTVIPYESNAYRLQNELTEINLFSKQNKYTPKIGDLVFFENTGDNYVDKVGILAEIITSTDNSTEKFVIIKGDTINNSVESVTYNADSVEIFGYGMINSVFGKSDKENVNKPIVESEEFVTNSSISLMAAGDTPIGNRVDFNQNMFNSNNTYILFAQSGSKYYAIDGNAKAVPITVDANGNVYSDVADANSLYWTFTSETSYDNRPTFYIQNNKSSMYLHPYYDNAQSHGAILSGRWESALYANGTGARIRGARQNNYAYLQNNSTFTNIGTLNEATTFYFAKTPKQCAVWLDGTNGNLMGHGGSPNVKYSVGSGSTFKLPETWDSPIKYGQTLKGWYDISNNKYYPPGAEVTISGDTVFYAYWVASTYDFGYFNSSTSQTVSTNDFITTHVFDYNMLFNVQSSSATVSYSNTSHSEVWRNITNGNAPYTGQPSLNYIFRDWDSYNSISYPDNHTDRNTNGSVYSGLYTDELREILFGTDNAFNTETAEGIIGKTYLGEGDHLFKLMTDPEDEHYGYYYYDSSLHAASYNQSQQRFYVYDYLERTSDSANSSTGKYSDFLPFNSPYANTNDKNVVTYTYNGDKGEYAGTTHYTYDAKYNSSGSSTNNVGTNFAFGMSIDMRFYMPDSPGTILEDGSYGNKDIYGNDMHFKFSGDDDVWVLLDGKLILDIGGIHGIETGDVNFSTGIVTVNGSQVSTITNVEEGEHILTVLYLERGSSQSNCAIYFNLAPRYSLTLQKEDVLTTELLNGAEFSVFTDKNCTKPAVLWETRADYSAEKPSTNVFTVKNGIATIWGLSPGKTYYIKETKPPNNEEYSLANGIISIFLDKLGTATYSVEMIPETDEEGNELPISNGFTIHGYRIDEQTQNAYISITNGKDWIAETTMVEAEKIWNDNLDHSQDSVTFYLNITDPDGTVRRIREITIDEKNDWKYTWTNLPKYYEDGITEVKYGVEEAYKSGYYQTTEKLTQVTIKNTTWAEALTFKNGEIYILKTNNGCLATTSSNSTAFTWVNEETAKTSPLALWKATVSNNNVKFTNSEGQIITFNYSYQSSGRYVYPLNGSSSYQNIRYSEAGNGLRFGCVRNNTTYYLTSLNTSNGRISVSTSSGSAMVFTPKTQIIEETQKDVEHFYYRITNTPLEEETSVKIIKHWDLGNATDAFYDESQVTIRLFANGVDTGRTVTLNLKNGWTDTFLGLPYKDDKGDVIKYSVVETWDTPDWIPSYGEVIEKRGDPVTYEIAVTNQYRWGYVYELPATGGVGTHLYTIGGLLLLLSVGICLLYKYKKCRKRSESTF